MDRTSQKTQSLRSTEFECADDMESVLTSVILPKSITLNKNEHFLEIIWADDVVCKYPLSELREACPCVECRGGHQFMGRDHDPKDILQLTPARSYQITSIDMVGNYALQPSWDDGHHTGIYTWDYLRRLCPAGER